MPVEHGETLPAWSVVRAKNVVDEFAVTVAAIAKAPVVAFATVATPTNGSLHEVFVYKRTVELASAVPLMTGFRLLFDGDTGVVDVSVGAAGARLSWR